MAVGILLLLGTFIVYLISKIGENLHTPMPPFESDKEFWDYQIQLSGIVDPAERRAFEQKKKRELLARQKAKEQRK